MTDTPIYDQIRRELGQRAEIRQTAQVRSISDAGDSVSVWALIDRTRRANDRTR